MNPLRIKRLAPGDATLGSLRTTVHLRQLWYPPKNKILILLIVIEQKLNTK